MPLMQISTEEAEVLKGGVMMAMMIGAIEEPTRQLALALLDRLESHVKDPSEEDKKAFDLAREHFHVEGEIEIDDEPIISHGDDNGAYVSAWVWVDFSGTPLDKEAQSDDDDSEDDVIEETSA